MRLIDIKPARLAAAVIVFIYAISYPVGSVASPAYPEPVTVVQPDGTTLTLRLYGDEFFSYATTIDGYNVRQGGDKFYYYAMTEPDGSFSISGIRAKEPGKRTADDRAAMWNIGRGVPSHIASAIAARTREEMGIEELQARKFDNDTGRVRPMSGENEEFRSIVILVNFTDLSFRTENDEAAFSDLLNEVGYSLNKATGSAFDYYKANSNSRFQPTFDVFGPYDLPNNMAYYGAHAGASKDANRQGLIRDACLAADEDPRVDFSKYVGSDGVTVRDIFVFYAGHSEAEGGGDNAVWPHRSRLSPKLRLDGVDIYGYACASELRGDMTSVTRAAIGTFCHEFGHVVGWPDFYDTDYEENGTVETINRYSVMDRGLYNNNSSTPPCLTAMERYLVGWLEPEEFDFSGYYTLPPVSRDRAYIIHTTNPGEFFLLETRNSEDNIWDRKLAEYFGVDKLHGLLVTHADRSSYRIPGASGTALTQWEKNKLNCYAVHPCFKVVEAQEGEINGKGWIFPGPGKVTILSGDDYPDFLDWNGNDIGTKLTEIETYEDGVIFWINNGREHKTDFIFDHMGENDVRIRWEDSDYDGEYKVELLRKGSVVFDEVTSEKSIYIPYLTPGMAYNIRLTRQTGSSSGVKFQADFKTDDIKHPFAYISGINGTSRVGRELPLTVRGVSGTIRSLEWTVDGEPVSPPTITLPAGRHEIKVVISLTERDREVLTKIIKVNN